MAHQAILVPVPRTCECYRTWQKGLVEVIKDLEMERLSWIIYVDLR